MILTNQHPKRYGIYVFFDKGGFVDDYNIVFLEALRKVTDKLLVIVNGEADDEGMAKMGAVADEVIKRPNEGFDITAYNLGLFRDGYEALCEYDEAIVCNGTNYGPFFPFEEMFDAMAVKDVDFWGVTAFHEVPFDPFGTIRYGYIPEHVQSYFQVYRKDFMKTDDFRLWWQEMPQITSYGEAIGFHESVFTKAMSDKGYKWAVYADASDLEGFTWDPLRDFPRYLIEKKRCPFIKRRSFFHDYGEAYGRSGGEATREAFEYIRDHTDYDTDLIWQNLLRTENMADLKKRMHLNYVLSTKVPAADRHDPNKKIQVVDQETNKLVPCDHSFKVALLYLIYFDDEAPFCAHYAEQMPEGTDIFIAVPSEEKMAIVAEAFKPLEDRYNVHIRLWHNRGRDVSALLVSFKDIIMDYDLVLSMHDKKVNQVSPKSIGHSWAYMCFESLAANKVFVENVIDLFEKNPRLGMLMPPVPVHGPYFPTTGRNEWGLNFAVTKQLHEDLGMTVPLTEAKEPVAPLGTEFWVRPKALKVLFDRGWEYEDFPPEPNHVDATLLHAIERLYPYCAQEAGYYAGWLMPDTYAKIHLDNWRFLNSGLTKAESERIGTWTNFREFIDAVKNS
ncbi:MAG: rhamnan synthesis protein F [Lachnospiraceae bacterium]|nr:rhamnan synthesis protein F [Candidatus Equihabitans merdae]